MKKTLYSFLVLLIVVVCVGSATAYASDTPDVTYSWTATYNGTRIETNFNQAQLTAMLSNMLPGDEMQFSVRIVNGYSRPTRWYMKNWVAETLEKMKSGTHTIASEGGYSYQLSYNGTMLYDSDVGGEDQLLTSDQKSKEGLEGATVNLDEYFFLDTLNTNESGIVTLRVKLDGETQSNVYQNTAAQIVMQFAVEQVGGNTVAVKTGDENNLTPYYIVMVVTGLLFLYLALDAFTDRLYKKGKG